MGGGIYGEFGTDKDRLRCLEWMTKKDRLYRELCVMFWNDLAGKRI